MRTFINICVAISDNQPAAGDGKPHGRKRENIADHSTRTKQR